MVFSLLSGMTLHAAKSQDMNFHVLGSFKHGYAFIANCLFTADPRPYACHANLLFAFSISKKLNSQSNNPVLPVSMT
jgi:hypothetical protein